MSRIVTDYVHPDEPCYGGFEGPLMREVGLGSDWRWCQVVRVIRGDEKAEYLKDMGPAHDFDLVTPIMIPSFGENKVGHILELLERNRHDTYWQTRAREMQEANTLIPDMIRQAEQIHEVINNRTTFGAAGHFQRNGYSHITTERGYMARKRQKTGRIQIK